MRTAGRAIRLGVVGHTGYTELDGALQALRRLAPGLNLELHLEDELPGRKAGNLTKDEFERINRKADKVLEEEKEG